MASSDLVMHAEDIGEIELELARLHGSSNARFVFLVDRTGQNLAQVGDTDGVDATSLASLTAGNVAATEGLAQLIGENAFTNLFQEGERENLHISLVGSRSILVLAFDERSSLGLVRLRVKQSTTSLRQILDTIDKRTQSQSSSGAGDSPFAEITDEDIDSLFSD